MRRAMVWWTAMAVLILAAGPARCGTVAAEYCNTDTNGDPYLPNTGGNAYDFVNTMAAFGHPAHFVNGNTNFWTGDLVDPRVSGAWDPWFADSVNDFFFSTHGASTSNAFLISPGHDNTVDGVNSHISFTNFGGHQWWDLGNGSLRILSMVSCHSLELSDIAHWDPVADGIHMLTGGSGDMYDNPGRGHAFALWGNVWTPLYGGPSIKQAWFMASPDTREEPVVLAYGVDSNDALNRLNNENFHWSTRRLGPRTYRWWAWLR